MNLQISGHHIEVTDALREAVIEKLKRVSKRFNNITSINVVLVLEKHVHKAEATLHLSHGNYHAEAVEKNMYTAIDAMVDKLIRQVTKHKEQVTQHTGPGIMAEPDDELL